MGKAQEAAETIEAIENALEVLEDSKEREQRRYPLFWEPEGKGGAAIEGLKMIRDRLRERGN